MNIIDRNKIFTGGGGNSGDTHYKGYYANYAALIAATLTPNSLNYVTASQGTKWLPGSLGGTYYPKGWYFYDGVNYTPQDTPFNASLATVNTGTNNDQFVTPSTLANTTILNSKYELMSRTAMLDANLVGVTTDVNVCTSIAFTVARTYTLPAANSVPIGWEITVQDELGTVTSTNTLTILRSSTDTIDGATTEVLVAPYAWRRFISNGVDKWSFDKGVVRKSDSNYYNSLIGITINGNGGVITAGNYGGYIRIPYTGIITGWQLYEGSSTPISSIVTMDTWKKSSFYPTVTDTIFGTKPALTSQTNNSATGLSIAVTAGDIMTFNVDSCTSAKIINLFFNLQKS